MPAHDHIHVIACGVLALDLERLEDEMELAISTDFLPGGLHETPHKLRNKLQEAIDAASDNERISRIVVGYGLCGRGTVGIHARSKPLIIPRVQDCIALFLGSDRAYREQFEDHPGTYYISGGWFEEKVEPLRQDRIRSTGPDRGRNDSISELSRRYGGEDNARAIRRFYDSWKRNYERAAFIDTGTSGRDDYSRHAREMAEQYGWEYERLSGDLSLLRKALRGDTADGELLRVPPGHVTAYDAPAGALKAVPPERTPERSPQKAADEQGTSRASRTGDIGVQFGLGIDAGGTYTDVAMYDFRHETVVARSKSLTTHWNYLVGIQSALDNLDPELIQKAGIVSISTTLATNAIVEGQGQKVGLLVMPPYGMFDQSDFNHRPTLALSAQLDITGEEKQPVNELEVRNTARELREKGAGAFAVSGFASTINPAHEIEVKRILQEETGLSVSCGHELSEMLNFRTRAHTAVLNARIIPRLKRFLRQTREALHQRGVNARMMTVRGDGTLMNRTTAIDKPVETILSGPAASVAGAQYLTGLDDALVVDIGGTTTDTASLRNGEVRVSEEGTQVGGWQTHVRALKMRTIGLGGDSLVGIEDGQLTIGPRRVAPLAWVATGDERLTDALHYLRDNLARFTTSTEGLTIATLTGHRPDRPLDERSADIMDVLETGPHSLAELAEGVGCDHWSLLNLQRLEENHLVQLCGLTPTDLLHASGEFQRWDAGAARFGCRLYAHLLGEEPTTFIRAALQTFNRMLAEELVKKQLDEKINPDAMDDCEGCNEMLEGLLGNGGPLGLSAAPENPVVGIGAPVHHFLPPAGNRLNMEVVIPENADVANAVGAITSTVVVSHSARIQPTENGLYVVEGVEGAPTFEDLEVAHDYATDTLSKIVRQNAERAGTTETSVQTRARDRISTAADGTDVFIERIVNARLEGAPNA